MRSFLIALTLLIALPVVAKAAELPTVITDALNDAASTGNPLVVEAVSDRMGRLFPAAKADIQNYVADIATPATVVAAVVKQDIMQAAAEPAKAESSEDIFDLETAAGPDHADGDLAAEMNAIDVGSPELVQ